MNKIAEFSLSFIITIISFIVIGALFNPLFEAVSVVLFYLVCLLLIAIISFKYQLRYFCYGILFGVGVILVFAVLAILVGSQLH